MKGFIQFNRNQEEIELFKQRPTAFLLLALICQRAKWSHHQPNKGLQPQEAYIGDWSLYCSSREIYRNDIRFLVKHQKATIKTTNKGTIVKIISTSPFNINYNEATTTLTNQPPTSHQQATTNKKDKRIKDIQTSKNSLTPCSESEIKEIARHYGVSFKSVNYTHDAILNQIASNEFKHKTVYYTLRTWVARGISKGEIEVISTLTDAERKLFYKPDPPEVKKWKESQK